MAPLDWTDSYATGVRELDDEHRRMLSCINQLEDVIRDNLTRPAAVSTLSALLEATIKHFDDEERLMEARAFSGLALHRTDHARLLTQLRDYHRRVASGKLSVSPPLVNALKAWFTNHASLYDRKLAEFLR